MQFPLLAAACTHSLPGRFGSPCQTTFWMTGLDGAKVSSHAQGEACMEMSQKQEGFRHKQEWCRLGNRLVVKKKIPYFLGFLNSEGQYYIFPPAEDVTHAPVASLGSLFELTELP